jgi:hypothetical protein
MLAMWSCRVCSVSGLPWSLNALDLLGRGICSRNHKSRLLDRLSITLPSSARFSPWSARTWRVGATAGQSRDAAVNRGSAEPLSLGLSATSCRKSQSKSRSQRCETAVRSHIARRCSHLEFRETLPRPR